LVDLFFGSGCETGEIDEGGAYLVENEITSLDAHPALGTAGRPVSVMPFERKPKRTYIGFGDNAEKFADKLGVPVVRIDGFLLTGGRTLYDAYQLWKDGDSRFLGMLSDREKQYFTERQADEKAEEEAVEAMGEDCEDDPVYDSKWTIPEDERKKIEGGLEGKAEQCYMFNNKPVSEYNGLFTSDSHVVVFVAPSDLRLKANDSSERPGDFVVATFMSRYRESIPDATSLFVLVNDSFDSFGPEYGPYYMHNSIENVDMNLFVTWDELPTVRELLTCPGDLCYTMMLSQVPYPRLHNFTLGSALGQTLEDGEIMLPELAFGDASPLAESLFGVSKPKNFFFKRSDGTSITRQVLPSSGAGGGGSIIVPTKLLIRLLGNTVISDCETYFAKEKDFFAGTRCDDEMCLKEACSNVTDLISEYEQMSSAEVRADDGEEEGGLCE